MVLYTIYSDSSSCYETTYSEDERIEKELREEREARERLAEEEDRARQEAFELVNSERQLPLFQLAGLTFHTVRHRKIKFSFHPATLTNFASNRVIFYVSLRYKGRSWRVKRDSLPANYKRRIYRLFYGQKSFLVRDKNVFVTIERIYDILMSWAKNEEVFRLNKFERYKNGEDVQLDSDDEQLFLTSEERVELYQKKVRILRRMVPPRQRR